MMINTFLARLAKPKVLLGLVIGVLLTGVTIYLVPKKLDEHGICWAKGRAMSDEELYQNAMQEYINQSLAFRNHKVAKKMEWCREDWACQMWIGEALDRNQVIQKIGETIGLDTKGFTKQFKLSRFDSLEKVNHQQFKLGIRNNHFIFANTDSPHAILWANDCCGIRNYQELINAKNLSKNESFALSAINPENRLKSKKFLQVDEYLATDIYSYSNYYLSKEAKNEDVTKNNYIHTYFIPLSSCGTYDGNPFRFADDMPNPGNP